MSAKYWVYSDFDGTITLDDNQVTLLDAFAPKNWRKLEYAILDEGGKSRQYLPVIYRDFSLRDKEEIKRFLRDNVRPDPHFPEFVKFCREHNLPLEIISDGMHFYIDDYLERFGLSDLAYYSNKVEVDEEGFRFEHPHVNLECGKCGTCKDKIVAAKQAEGYKVIYIGDGISDECAARRGDLLFAKGKLARFCEREGINYIPYETFADILEYFQGTDLDGVSRDVAK